MCFPAVRLVLRIGIAQHPTHERVFVGRQAANTVAIVDISVCRAYGTLRPGTTACPESPGSESLPTAVITLLFYLPGSSRADA